MQHNCKLAAAAKKVVPIAIECRNFEHLRLGNENSFAKKSVNSIKKKQEVKHSRDGPSPIKLYTERQRTEFQVN